MELFTGKAVASGVAVADAVVLVAEDVRIPYRTVPREKVADELTLLDTAVHTAIVELERQTEDLADRAGQDTAAVFRWHIGVLNDARLRSEIESLIKKKRHAAAYATSTVMRHQQQRFLRMTDPLLAERVRDVQDIERRLLRHILGEKREDLAHLTTPIVLVAHDLSPSQVANLASTKVVGLALDVGGPTSHTAILLRALGRPAVIGLNDISTRISGGDLVIVDGSNQLVIVDPDETTLAEYRAQERSFVRLTDELDHLRDLEAVTRDGSRIQLLGNIEFPEEAAKCVEKGADGVGLYRTEFLFLGRTTEPSEEEQYQAYRSAIAGAGGRPVTIRTFDLGADKYTQEKIYEPEPNPMLGLRSIRYSLRNLDMFKTQLRAILRASVLGNVRLMFPLIVSLMELRQAKMTLRDAMEDLEEEGVGFERNLPVGMMVETPAAAMQCEAFASEVDFMSIGTNDLVQYLLAVDRGNERVSRYYNSCHPAVLRCLRTVIRTCNRTGVEVSLCGEVAGEPLYTLLLLGLGLRSFSMAPGNAPEIKKLVRLTTISHGERVAKRALTFETERQVTNYLRDETRKLLPDDPI
ncbi:MAG TPA: phosphoenolpyruvate--protein phosphotransferase [Phycisphaerae bacterium]|nr:phosphoenolpyruvate--protein phosphotransferase [Phycisphaerae bacterium]